MSAPWKTGPERLALTSLLTSCSSISIRKIFMMSSEGPCSMRSHSGWSLLLSFLFSGQNTQHQCCILFSYFGRRFQFPPNSRQTIPPLWWTQYRANSWGSFSICRMRNIFNLLLVIPLCDFSLLLVRMHKTSPWTCSITVQWPGLLSSCWRYEL